ncbi:unnamed protein product [Closterium sp. NIES-64]|nr:unnamed protein product [Closterium sp. NIES-64]
MPMHYFPCLRSSSPFLTSLTFSIPPISLSSAYIAPPTPHPSLHLSLSSHPHPGTRAPPFRFGKDPNLESGEPDEEELDMAATVVGDDEL